MCIGRGVEREGEGKVDCNEKDSHFTIILSGENVLVGVGCVGGCTGWLGGTTHYKTQNSLQQKEEIKISETFIIPEEHNAMKGNKNK
jgi:hypothetical protein